MMTDSDFDLFKAWLIITTAIAYRDAEHAQAHRSADRLTRWGEFHAFVKCLSKTMDVSDKVILEWCDQLAQFQLEVMVDMLRRRFGLKP